MKDVMLTTVDNPWNPFTQFDEWYIFDEVEASHHTCGYIARMVDYVKEQFGYNDDIATDVAIEMIAVDEPEIYKKVENSIFSA